jgi:hypothetical protein
MEEQMNDALTQFSELQQKHEFESNKWITEETQLKASMCQSKSTTSELQKATDALKQKHKGEMEKIQSELIDARDGSSGVIEDLQTQLLEKTEEMKSIKTMA